MTDLTSRDSEVLGAENPARKDLKRAKHLSPYFITLDKCWSDDMRRVMWCLRGLGPGRVNEMGFLFLPTNSAFVSAGHLPQCAAVLFLQ